MSFQLRVIFDTLYQLVVELGPILQLTSAMPISHLLTIIKLTRRVSEETSALTSSIIPPLNSYYMHITINISPEHDDGDDIPHRGMMR